MRTRTLLLIIAVSWVADAQTNGLELPVRLAYLSGLLVAAMLGLGANLEQSKVSFLGLFLLANSAWIFAGARDGAALSTILVDLTIVFALGAVVLSASQLRHDLERLERFWRIVPFIGLTGAILVSLLSSSAGRGELPPTALAAISAALLLQNRYMLGAAGVASYSVLTIESGFRSSALLVVLAIVLVVGRMFVGSRPWRKALLVVALVPLIGVGFNLAQEALSGELAGDTRAFQFSTSGTNAAASDQARIAEIESSLRVIEESTLVDLVVGRGHGSKVLDEQFDRRTAHNVWLTFIVRYGALGIVGALWVHSRVYLRCRDLIRSNQSFTDSIVTIGGFLVVVNGYLRFSIAELSELLLLAVAIGVTSDDG